MQFGILASSAQTELYPFTGSETTINLNPGTYDITAYGAQGYEGYEGRGGLGAEMSGEFNFSASTTLTLLVGGGVGVIIGAGGGGGSFVVEGSTPLVIAGGGGGGGDGPGGSGLVTTTGGNAAYGGGVGYAGGGGGGGSIIDSSGIVLAEVSGVASPDGSPDGEIIITEVPEPTSLALAGLSGLILRLFRRQRK